LTGADVLGSLHAQPMHFPDYKEIFDARGGQYERAMRLYPDARAQEFEMILGLADLQPGWRVVDAPAGGGYLAAFSHTPVEWIGIETTSVFGSACAERRLNVVCTRTLTNLPLADETVDCVISLAGVHHLTDAAKTRFFGEALRILRPGGVFALADVHEHSPVAAFLNGFVDAHNPMGHDGLFLGEHTTAALRGLGFGVENGERHRYFWNFPSERAMGRFCGLLFGLEGVDEDTIAQAVADILGRESTRDGVAMRWELMGLRCVKP